MAAPAWKKERAVALREQGYTYPDIAKKIGVSKSTLSLWLRHMAHPNVPKGQTPETKKLRYMKSAMGTRAHHRLKREGMLQHCRDALADVEVSSNALLFVGTALYWAEGTKSRSDFSFANSDPTMMCLFMEWARHVLKIPEQDFVCNINVHVTNGITYDKIEQYWSDLLHVPRAQFRTPTIQKGTTTPYRTNVHIYGVVRTRVHKALRYHAMYSALVEKLGGKTSFVE